MLLLNMKVTAQQTTKTKMRLTCASIRIQLLTQTLQQLLMQLLTYFTLFTFLSKSQ